MSIQTDEGVITRRSPALYFTSVTPTAPKAWLGVLHGYADHGARYLHVMGALAEQGIGCVALDMRGHGRAEGRRGYCERFDEFLDDVAELERLLEQRAKGAPTMLFAHSFGGLVATLAVLEGRIHPKALALSAPFFELGMEVPEAKKLAAKVAARLYPTFALPSGLSGKDVTHDVARQKAYDEDPLVFKKATARWFVEAQGAQEKVKAGASRLSLPLYLVYGTADTVASPAAMRRVVDAASSTDKTIDERAGKRHEAWNEADWKDLADGLARWVLDHA